MRLLSRAPGVRHWLIWGKMARLDCFFVLNSKRQNVLCLTNRHNKHIRGKVDCQSCGIKPLSLSLYCDWCAQPFGYDIFIWENDTKWPFRSFFWVKITSVMSKRLGTTLTKNSKSNAFVVPRLLDATLIYCRKLNKPQV